MNSFIYFVTTPFDHHRFITEQKLIRTELNNSLAIQIYKAEGRRSVVNYIVVLK